MKVPSFCNSPIRKNMTANLFGTGVQFFNQIVLVPFFILFWGNALYSDWIVLSALSAVFSMSDIGLNNVIQNRFAIKMAEGNLKECKSLLTDNYILIALVFLIAFLFCCFYLAVFDITSQLDIHSLSRTDANTVFILLLCKVFLDMFRTIENAVYRAFHNASRAILFDQGTNLLVAFLILGCLLLKVPMAWMCLFMIVPLFGMIMFKYYDVRKFYDYTFSVRDFDGGLLKQIVVPAISFMSFPAGNAIVLQGYTMAVNCFFGADSVVLYNTTRTLCNFSKTLLNTLQNSVWPEYSIAFGNRDNDRMRYLHRKIIKVTVTASSMIGVLLLSFGPIIYGIWTKNAVVFSFELMAVYVAALFVESLWTSSSVTLMSTNNHLVLGVIYILSAASSLFLCVIIGEAGCTLPWIAATLIILHIIMCLYTIPAGFRLTKDSLWK